MLSLRQAARVLFPKAGKPATRSLLLYHIGTGTLRPDHRQLVGSCTHYQFTRATLRAFARARGWQYQPGRASPRRASRATGFTFSA